MLSTGPIHSSQANVSTPTWRLSRSWIGSRESVRWQRGRSLRSESGSVRSAMPVTCRVCGASVRRRSRSWNPTSRCRRPAQAPPGRPRPHRTSPASAVDINRATVDDLVALPGIGPALAARIVDARGKQMFARIEDLVRVRGIGPATLERLRPLVTARGGRRSR